MITLEPICYKDLNGKQKENYNFHKLSSKLADFGYTCIRLSDDWDGADLIAVHNSGSMVKIQLKPRLYFKKAYKYKDLFIAFPHGGNWFLIPHDAICELIIEQHATTASSKSWASDVGQYSFPRLSKRQLELLDDYKIPNQKD